MNLEAVWFKNGKEVLSISPIVNIVCFEEMKRISDIEINDGHNWHSYKEADDFIVRIKK